MSHTEQTAPRCCSNCLARFGADELDDDDCPICAHAGAVVGPVPAGQVIYTINGAQLAFSVPLTAYQAAQAHQGKADALLQGLMPYNPPYTGRDDLQGQPEPVEQVGDMLDAVDRFHLERAGLHARNLVEQVDDIFDAVHTVDRFHVERAERHMRDLIEQVGDMLDPIDRFHVERAGLHMRTLEPDPAGPPTYAVIYDAADRVVGRTDLLVAPIVNSSKLGAPSAPTRGPAGVLMRVVAELVKAALAFDEDDEGQDSARGDALRSWAMEGRDVLERWSPVMYAATAGGLVEAWVQAHGAPGLRRADGCSCTLNCFMPCGGVSAGCVLDTTEGAGQ